MQSTPESAQSDQRADAFRWRHLTPFFVGSFSIGADSSILYGILPMISSDTGYPVASIAQSVALFPLVYGLTAPFVAIFTANMSRRFLCTLGMFLFALGNLVSAVADDLVVFSLGRVLTAFGACLYIPNASATAMAAAGPERDGRAMSIVNSGFTTAIVLGAPLGVMASSLIGWRWMLVLIALVSLTASAAQVMNKQDGGRPEPTGVRSRLLLAKDARMLLILLLTILVVAGEYVVYVYISVVVGNVNENVQFLSAALFLFGSGNFLGTLLGGVLADRYGWLPPLAVSVPAIAVLMASLALADSEIPLLAVLLAWSTIGWTFMPAQIKRMMHQFPKGGAVMMSLNSSALFLAYSAGGFLGGAVLRGTSVESLPLFGAGVVLASLPVLVIGIRMQRRSSTVEDEPAAG